MIGQPIPKRSLSCASCGRKFNPEEECHSSLKLAEEEWLRDDRCSACDASPGDVQWKTTIPAQAVKPSYSTESLWELFHERYAAKDFAPAYLLAHMLVRQKDLDAKREPFFQNQTRGALFIDPQTEREYFIVTAFVEGALDQARTELKQLLSHAS